MRTLFIPVRFGHWDGIRRISLTWPRMFPRIQISGLMVGMRTWMPWLGLLVPVPLFKRSPGSLMVEPGDMLRTWI